jgi:hypothetical protein
LLSKLNIKMAETKVDFLLWFQEFPVFFKFHNIEFSWSKMDAASAD